MIAPPMSLWVHYQDSAGKYVTSLPVLAIAQIGNGFTAVVLHDGKIVPAHGTGLRVTTIDNRDAAAFLSIRDKVVAAKVVEDDEKLAPVLDQKLVDAKSILKPKTK